MEKDRELEGKEILQYTFVLEKHAFRRHKLWLWHLLVWPMADPFGKLYGPNWWCVWYRTCIISIHRIKYIAMVFLRQLNAYSTLKTSHTHSFSLATTHTQSNMVIHCAISLLNCIRSVTHSNQHCDWSMVGGRCHELGLKQSIRPDHPYPVCFIPSLMLDKKLDKHVQITHTNTSQGCMMTMQRIGSIDFLLFLLETVSCYIDVMKHLL